MSPTSSDTLSGPTTPDPLHPPPPSPVSQPPPILLLPDNSDVSSSHDSEDHYAIANHALASRSDSLPLESRQPLPEPPRGIRAARRHSHVDGWRAAYENERQAHIDFATFSPVSRSTLPPHTKVYKLITAFSYKYDKEGRLAGYKARFAFPGNRLQPGVHFDSNDTAAFTASRDAVRMIVSLAAQKDLLLKHADLKNAFLRYAASTAAR